LKYREHKIKQIKKQKKLHGGLQGQGEALCVLCIRFFLFSGKKAEAGEKSSSAINKSTTENSFFLTDMGSESARNLRIAGLRLAYTHSVDQNKTKKGAKTATV
jgi:hypothetical protein